MQSILQFAIDISRQTFDFAVLPRIRYLIIILYSIASHYFEMSMPVTLMKILVVQSLQKDEMFIVHGSQ